MTNLINFPEVGSADPCMCCGREEIVGTALDLYLEGMDKEPTRIMLCGRCSFTHASKCYHMAESVILTSSKE
jgi:hypothetical protein